jgi:arylsulfatase A-like enzyme
MDRRSFLATLGGAGVAAAAPATPPPNIVILFADDLGYSDVGPFGGEIRTPHLDSLAKEGVRFTHFYNTARCCPSRATLLSGLYAHQAGIGHMVNPKPFPAYAGDLNRKCVTLAEALKPAGYETYMSGKWHVTPFNEDKHNWPLQRGFDKYFGIIAGAGNYFDPHSLTRDNERIERDSPDFYLTDAIGNNAVHYIEQAKGPFLMYTAFTSPHWPLHALQPDIDRYRGRYKGGWDALREERRSRMIKMGILDKRWPLTPRDSTAPSWSEAANKDWQQRRMEVYAAQVDRMDQNIGKIMDALRKKGQLDNTLVMFLADNGGCAEDLAPGSNPTYMAAAVKRGVKVETGNIVGRMPGHEDSFESYGLPWANASNTPFRLYKHWVHEGGISSPFIARWPKGVRGTNTMTHEPAHLIDIMATCVDVSGTKYPSDKTPMQGKSLAAAFQGKKIERTDSLYWEHEGNKAIRDGKHKLVSRHPDRWELYDIEADRSELNDLAAREPATAQRMAGKWDQWAAKVGVEDFDKVQKSRMPA